MNRVRLTAALYAAPLAFFSILFFTDCAAIDCAIVVLRQQGRRCLVTLKHALGFGLTSYPESGRDGTMKLRAWATGSSGDAKDRDPADLNHGRTVRRPVAVSATSRANKAMIKNLKLLNYRSHADTSFPLQPITLFVGPVSVGKSNVLRSLVTIQNSIHYSLVEMFPPGIGEFHWVRSRWAGETDPIGFEVDLQDMEDFPGRGARYKLLIADSPDGLYVLEESLQSRDGDQPWEWVFQRRMRGHPNLGEFGSVAPRDPTLLHKVFHRVPDLNLKVPGNLRPKRA